MSTALGVARRLAEHMDGWRAEPFSDMDEREVDHGAYLVGPEDVRLFVRTGQYNLRGRAEISVHHELPPGTRLYDIPHPKITVSLDREPAAAARDILRRLVPEAIAATVEVRSRLAREQARRAEVAEVAEALSVEFPHVSTRGHQPDRDERTLWWSPPGNGYGKFRISNSSARGDLHSLSIPQLRRVLRALAEPDEETSQ